MPRVTPTRTTYLDAATAACDLLARPEVGQAWDRQSALVHLDVAALAAHLARAVLQVEAFLDHPEPDREAELFDAVAYYLADEGLADVSSPSSAAVRERAAGTAAVGHAQLVQDTQATIERLRTRLGAEREDRRVTAFGRPMLLDEYLRTRLVEIAVHLDDLAVSLGFEATDVPPGADDALDVLVGIALGRMQTIDALRSLTRRERASRVLRAF